jgi:hypothetical protein
MIHNILVPAGQAPEFLTSITCEVHRPAPLRLRSRKRASLRTLLFRFRRRPTEWGVGAADLQIFVRKVLSSAGSPTWSNRQELTEQGRAPPTETDLPIPHPSPVVKRFYVPTARHRVDSARIHPKMGSTVGSSRTGWAAGKPSDEPLRKGETQVHRLWFGSRQDKNVPQRLRGRPSCSCIIDRVL